ncbi:DUF4212 domain-containing protein [Azoarcus indigens]|uniref:Putative solute:sodium symporter small subunit n=1 Tax=Azoarcus indigens TaxID=29545 RepID=A0A4R6DYL5_9RHOO|nr:DUF4212 domain-containing protein [Azoarcus indigens]NMG65610.1 DUF4212 domain-containing protein [Azoarcus indigens]TDN49984.1 putative solute:sodium symporter small subunit [Azoarcus indigens]
MTLTARHRAYWRRNLALTLGLLALWFLVSFLPGYYATELNNIVFLGFPLGFYVFAQGTPLIHLLIIGIYVLIMNRLDKRFGVDEHGR